MGLDASQEVAHLHVGIAVPGFLHLAPLAEQAVGLVELQDHGSAVGVVEQPVQVFFRLADVLAHQAPQVDPVQGPPQTGGQDSGGKCLSGSGGAGKEPHRAAAVNAAPGGDHGRLVGDPEQELPQHGNPVRREHQVLPAGQCPDPDRPRQVTCHVGSPQEARGNSRRRAERLKRVASPLHHDQPLVTQW